MVLEAAGDTRLIGEDLGTVPDYVRPNLTALGHRRVQDPHLGAGPPHRRSAAGQRLRAAFAGDFGTHDHEPLRALWNRWQQSPPDERAELAQARPVRRHLRRRMRRRAFTERVHDRLLAALFRSNSWIAVCMITDLLARDERFNVPGTAADSNWSQRMHVTLETLCEDPAHRQRTAAIRATAGRAGRDVPPADPPTQESGTAIC